MRKKFFIALTICFISLWDLFSQNQITISGIIREKSTKEVIVNASIKTLGYTDFSNERGFFSIRTAEGEQSLAISCIGFSHYKAAFYTEKDTVLVIELEEGLELDEVVVEHTPITLRSKGLGNIQLDVKQLRKVPLFLGERDVIKAMQFLPGVSSGIEGSSSLNIRGGTNDQTLYLMDDVPVYNQNHTFGLLSIFNPEVLRTAELYKGGIPSMYGNRLSGVANVYLKDGNMKEHNQSFSVGILSGAIHLEGPFVKDKLSYVISARRSFFDLISRGFVALSDHSNGVETFAFHDINAKTSWSINEKTNLSLQFYNGFDDLYGMNKDHTSDDGSKYSDKFGFGWNSTMTSLRLTSSLSSNIFLSNNIYYTNLNNFNYFQQKNTSSKNKQKLKNRVYSNLEELGLKSKIEHKLNNNNVLYYGIDASQQNFRPDYMEKVIDKNKTIYKTGLLNLNTVGIFVFNELAFSEWLLGLGLRSSLYDSRDKTLLTVEPRIKISRMLGEKNKVMLAYDYTTQPVHSLYEMAYTVQCDFWVPFKEDKVPTAQQYSIGWKNYLSPNLSLSLEMYWKEMKNLVRIDNLESYIDYHDSYVTGEGLSHGIEFMIQYDYKKISSWLSYTLSKSTRTFDGEKHPFKYDSPHDISAFISYDVYKKENRKNALSLNAQYRTGIPYFISSANIPSIGLPSYENGYIYDGYSSLSYIPKSPNTRLSNYFRTDINFTMERVSNKGKVYVWQFSLLNATGHVNPYGIYKNKHNEYEAFLLIPFLPSLSYTKYF